MSETTPYEKTGREDFRAPNPPELGSLILAISPRNEALFRASPVRSFHASLMRRIELVNPAASSRLHDDAEGASTTEHAWTISPLAGRFERSGASLEASPGSIYRVRVTALTAEVVQTLATAFDPEHPLGAEPLSLEWVPFDVIWDRSGWEAVATYASLLSAATPRRRAALEFRSPTGFRRGNDSAEVHWPTLCLQGYLRKWNAFSGIPMPEEAMLKLARDQLTTCRQDLQEKLVRLDGYSQKGMVGTVEWQASGNSPLLLRMADALVKYSWYCGTGMKTSLGMGQTVPVDVPAR